MTRAENVQPRRPSGPSIGRRSTPKAFASKAFNAQRPMQKWWIRALIHQPSAINHQPLRPLSILQSMDRNLCFVAAARAGRETCTSRARVIVLRASTPKAGKANRAISCLSCARSQMQDSLVIRTRANRPCLEKFPRPGRKLRLIRSRHYIQSLG